MQSISRACRLQRDVQLLAVVYELGSTDAKTTPQKTRFRSVNNYKEFTYR